MIAHLFVGALLLAPSIQEPLSLKRVFREGEADRYSVKLSVSAELGDVDIHFQVQQTVRKLLPGGVAEIESKIGQMKAFFNGQEMATPGPDAATTVRVGPNGMTSSPDSAKASNVNLFLLAGLLADKPLTVGKAVEMRHADPSDSKRTAQGVVTLLAVDKGLATLASRWTVAQPASAKPLEIEMSSEVEIATGKVSKASGTITGADPGGMKAKAIQFSLERL
jgi:hypothetical protein